MIRIMRMDKV